MMTFSGSTGIGMTPVRNARVKLMNTGRPSEMTSSPKVPNVEAMTWLVACSPATSGDEPSPWLRKSSSYDTSCRCPS